MTPRATTSATPAATSAPRANPRLHALTAGPREPIEHQPPCGQENNAEQVERRRTVALAEPHRLARYGAGRQIDFTSSTPEVITAALAEEIGRTVDCRPVDPQAAGRVAARLAELL